MTNPPIPPATSIQPPHYPPTSSTISSSPSPSPSPSLPSTVQVGVRVRPLTANEVAHASKSVLAVRSHSKSISLGKRSFTFDHVFDERINQNRLYSDVARPMLSSYLDGYNATILAYGQTGSGKTFTMGSEQSQTLTGSSDDCQGLIPRFMNDLFTALASDKKATNSNSNSNNINPNPDSTPPPPPQHTFNVTASFLEVYGEDVYDLLDHSRNSLPLREDGNGVSVVGLSAQKVTSTSEALNILKTGTIHRTTASTLMNSCSSRSHAVFTVMLSKSLSLSLSSSASPSASPAGAGAAAAAAGV